MTKISIITPCFNEEENVDVCANTLREVMQSELPGYDYEHIFADNASTDLTLNRLRRLAEIDKRIKVISNSRNVGPFRNMWNAMRSASGDAVIPLLPADLQDPPAVIPGFVRDWETGSLVVYGVRDKREESLLMRTVRGLYYRSIRRFASAIIPINSGEFLLADRKVIDSILATNDYYPYIRGLIAQTQVRSTSIPYTWVKRKNGKSKNSFISLIDQGINGFISTSRIPARLALLSGFALSFVGIIFAIVTAVLSLTTHPNLPLGIPTMIFGIFFLGGIQLFFIGTIGEYVLSIHGQVRRHPELFELERINFED
jgi:polyisoprenyl-phosphate glycosyltransferase